MIQRLAPCVLALLAVHGIAYSAERNMLQTIAEQSGFKKTGRYEEVERLCAAFAKTYPDAVRCEEFGRTPEGRPMLGLIASRSGALTPDVARQRGLPVVLAQGGIHAGEIEGKDAGFLALRELLEEKAAPGTLKSFVLVFVPVLNVDGHERFGRWNRPNQNGPEEMGWRTTAQNLNLNRDYTKLDAPETRAILRLLDAWDPILYVDLHTTDGAQFEHDVLMMRGRWQHILDSDPAYNPNLSFDREHQFQLAAPPRTPFASGAIDLSTAVSRTARLA